MVDLDLEASSLEFAHTKVSVDGVTLEKQIYQLYTLDFPDVGWLFNLELVFVELLEWCFFMILTSLARRDLTNLL